MRLAVLALLLACPGCKPPPGAHTGAEPETTRLRRQAQALAPLVSAPWVRRFIAAAQALPDVPTRTLFHDAAKSRFVTEAELAALPTGEREAFVRQTFDAEYYYETGYGSPLAYARALEVAEPADFDPEGARLFDFGYGGIGHLRMLASLGVDARGVDVDPRLRALYSFPGDQGPVAGGTITLFSGPFPADPHLKEAAGSGYRLVVSKNVLKHGYIHPDQPANERKLIHLGVDDETFLDTIHDMLEPGGRFLIYNICPGPNRPGKPFIPWADCRSPFSRELFQARRLRVIEFERDDLPAARAMAHALGWDKEDPPTDLEHDLQAQYTLVERPVGP